MGSLDAVFRPASVALIGASDRPGSVGLSVLLNLTSSGFRGAVYPVNPNHKELAGIPCYAAIDEVPGRVDLAVIAVPAPAVAGIVASCAAAGVGAAIVLSAGFRETGASGVALEAQVLQAAGASGMRIVGPNCLGAMSPAIGLNATFASIRPAAGSIAFVSQSGALGTAVLDWSIAEDVGFSHFLSVGSMLDVGWSDVIDDLGDDAATHAIVMYMESIGNAAAFFSAARAVTFSKPIVVLKAGRTPAAAKAAASHTGAMTGNDAAYDALFARCGVLRVESIDGLFSVAQSLAKQPRPRGASLAIVTNAGGAGVLATDALIAGGGNAAALAPQTLHALDGILPAHWSKQNPIDVLGDADAERYCAALELAATDPSADAVLSIFAPQAVASADEVAQRVLTVAPRIGKTFLAAWMGGPSVEHATSLLERSGIPTFAYPDEAARTFNALWRYGAQLQALYETPEPPEPMNADRVRTADLIARAVSERRTLLSEHESKAILEACGIDTVATAIAHSADEAVAAAHSIGFPVAVKLHSSLITHKSDVGGVQLDVRDDAGVRRAFDEIRARAAVAAGPQAFLGVAVEPMLRSDGLELIVGSSVEPGFGPVMLFGWGGVFVEIARDNALALPPLTTTLARMLIEQTRISKAFGGVRGRPPVDIGALERLLVRFSELVAREPRIREIEINPLVAADRTLTAVDARVVLYEASVADADLPQTIVRPYPARYAGEWQSADGATLVIRPVRPDDEPLVAQFARSLSPRSLYLRFGRTVAPDGFDHRMLARLCFADYRREIALVAVGAGPAVVAVARLVHETDAAVGEFALLVADDFQGRGLGRELLRRLIDVGRAEGLQRVVGYVLGENAVMLAICRSLGFSERRDPADTTVTATLELRPAGGEYER